MKKRRLLSCALSLSVALASVTSAVSALSFNDVENDTTVSWARASIEKMTEAGYIKGYEDGTFKPYRSISKMECLLLMSRMLGVEEDSCADIVSAAKTAYDSTVSKYNTSYKTELCYLMYLGVLNENDLVAYASSANANTELLRHQAAVLMAKMLGENTNASAYNATTPTYADNAAIPTASRPYVEYVTAQKLMNGMDANAEGKPQFSPVTSLTRAQMATLLSRMIDRVNKYVYTGTVESVDLDNNVISVTQKNDTRERDLGADAIARVDGDPILLKNLTKGSEATFVELGGHVQLIHVTKAGSGENTPDTPTTDGTVVYAKVTQLAESSSGKRITLADTEDSENTATYTVATDCAFLIKGSKAGYADIKKNDLVKVVVKNGKLSSVEVVEKTLTVEGTLTELEFDEENHVYLTVDSTADGEQKYVVSSLGAKLKRDGETAEYRELAAGDKVTMTLTSGKITDISATSSSVKFSGVLSEIIIATKPSVTIMIDGKEQNYKLRSDAKIKIKGADATIYDLRPNITVTGTLDGSEVKTLSASAVVTNEKGEFSGTVTGVNTTYKVITVTDESGNTQSVYYSSKTTFLKTSGSTATSRDIEKGANLSITGAENNGVFEATIIIIK